MVVQEAEDVGVLALEAVEEIPRAAGGSREDVPGVGLDLEVELAGAPAVGVGQGHGEERVGGGPGGREAAGLSAEVTQVDGDVEVAAPLAAVEPRRGGLRRPPVR